MNLCGEIPTLFTPDSVVASTSTSGECSDDGDGEDVKKMMVNGDADADADASLFTFLSSIIVYPNPSYHI